MKSLGNLDRGQWPIDVGEGESINVMQACSHLRRAIETSQSAEERSFILFGEKSERVMEVSSVKLKAGSLPAIDGGCLRYLAYTGVLWYVTLIVSM